MTAETANVLLMILAGYLRSHFTALTTEQLVPYEKQLEQVMFYLNIEKVRFRERVNVVFDTRALAFEVPTLTVQPLVENAVKHGICKRAGGGTVTIRSYENGHDFVVEIADDGVGFDIDSTAQDGDIHVGIANVKARLAYFGDVLEINSKPGVGTTVKIRIPKHGD